MNVGLLGLFLNGASHEGEKKKNLRRKKNIKNAKSGIWLKTHQSHSLVENTDTRSLSFLFPVN